MLLLLLLLLLTTTTTATTTTATATTQQQHRYKPKRWSVIAAHLTGRNGKQCRERWHNHLDPAIKRHPFTKEEDHTLVEAHASVGNKVRRRRFRY